MKSQLVFRGDVPENISIPNSSVDLHHSQNVLRNKTREKLYNLISSSVLSHIFSNVAPLGIDNVGRLYIRRDQFQLAELDEQDWITLELTLSFCSECRKKLNLISDFLAVSKIGVSPSGEFAAECFKPIKQVLQNFLDEVTESVQQKRVNIRDSWELFNFFTTLMKRLDPVFMHFKSILTANVVNLKTVLDYWKSFLRELVFLFDIDKWEWQEAIFEGFVQLLAKCLSYILLNSRGASNPTPEFVTLVCSYDPAISTTLSFLSRCIGLMPRQVLDGIPTFEKAFILHWENAKAKNCVRRTPAFLARIVRQALYEFSAEINGIFILEFRSSTVQIREHLQRIKRFYSLNAYDLGEIRLKLTPPHFEEFSPSTSFSADDCCCSLNKSEDLLEPELKSRLECISMDDGNYENVFFKMQHWSVSFLLAGQFYRSLDRIFLTLCRLVHAWHRLHFFEQNQLRKDCCTRILLKTRIRRQIFFRIGQFLQTVIQALFGQFTSLNDLYIGKLLKHFEQEDDGNNTSIQELLNILNDWSKNIDSLQHFIHDDITEPLDEAFAIVREFVQKSKNVDQLGIDEEDVEIKNYLALRTRLQRTRLYICNLELGRKCEKNGGTFSSNEKQQPQTQNVLCLIKMMLLIER